MRRPSVLGSVVWLLVAFLYAPLVVAVLFAFNSTSSLSWPISGLSLRWFRTIVNDVTFRDAFVTSIQAASATAVIAGAVATATAVVVTRRRTLPMRIVEGASLLPVMIPPLLIGVALLTALTAANTLTSLWTVILGHVVLVTPYVILVVTSRMRRLDLQLEEAARDLGAAPAQVLRRVTFRLIAPAVLGGGFLAFALSFDEVLVTNFTVGLDPTLPLFVFSKMRRSVDPSINAVATILLVMPWLALGIALAILRKSAEAPVRPTTIKATE